jgi:hypothetical protein
VAAGTGDNMGAALGLGLAPGEVAVSIGTSGTAFAVTSVPAADPSGSVAGFADATGRFLPLVCTVNAGLVLSAAADLIGTDLAGLSEAALAAEPGAGGITLLPYLDGERTPNRPHASGVLRGLTTRNATRQNLARARWAVLASPGHADLPAAGRRGAAQRALSAAGRGRWSVTGADSRPGHRARTRGVRCARRGAPGGVGAGGHAGTAGVAPQAGRGVHGPAAARPPRPVRRAPGRHHDVGRKDRAMTAGAAYQPAPSDRFSFGIWTVGWQGVDVFGPAVRPPMPADRAVRKLAELGASGSTSRQRGGSAPGRRT